VTEIFKIATNVSTPLMLAGFLAAAFFLIIRYILKKDIFPTLNRQLSSDIIKLIIERLFILALIALVLGFAGFVLTVLNEHSTPPEKLVDVPSYYIIAWSVESVSEAKDKVAKAKELGYKNAYYLLKDGSKKIAVVIEDGVLKEQVPYAIGAARNAGLPINTYEWPMKYVHGE